MFDNSYCVCFLQYNFFQFTFQTVSWKSIELNLKSHDTYTFGYRFYFGIQCCINIA